MTSWKKALTALFGVFAAASASVLLVSPVAAQPPGADAAIDAHYNEKGGISSPLGEKVGAVYVFGPNGAAQDYAGGRIVYSPDTGAKIMYGAILDKYLALGGADSDIGYPVNDESDAPVAGTARFSEFSAGDGATIHWNPPNGAWLVRGPIRTAWTHLNATDGVLGTPASDTTVADGTYSQTFRGQDGNPIDIRWSSAEGFVTNPPEIASQLSGLDVSVPGAPPESALGPGGPPPEANAGAAPGTTTTDDSGTKWWALPLGIVIAAAAGGLAALVTGRRSSGTTPRDTTGTTAAGGRTGTRATAGSHLATAAERARHLGLRGSGA
ncbi:LGFP repeat-containing protein [Nocardia sp. NPDC050406]|uniref:LGFP repeat-containing protein n=1 Tax=Nocardia sp. NPDC050406 TaxID=3364318 RepID=UPI00379D32EB